MDLSADSFANLTRLRDLFAFPDWLYEHKRRDGGFVYLVKFSALPFSNWQEHHEGSNFVYTHGTSKKYYAQEAVDKINDHMRQVTLLTKDSSQLLFQLWRFAKHEGDDKEIELFLAREAVVFSGKRLARAVPVYQVCEFLTKETGRKWQVIDGQLRLEYF